MAGALHTNKNIRARVAVGLAGLALHAWHGPQQRSRAGHPSTQAHIQAHAASGVHKLIWLEVKFCTVGARVPLFPAETGVKRVATTPHE